MFGYFSYISFCLVTFNKKILYLLNLTSTYMFNTFSSLFTEVLCDDASFACNGGTVAGLMGNCLCKRCPVGKTGDHCELVACTTAANGKPCENGASFVGSQTSDDCRCACSGYTGINCEVEGCATLNGFSCLNGGTITGTLNCANCACVCSMGYSGGLCATKDLCTKGPSDVACQVR